MSAIAVADAAPPGCLLGQSCNFIGGGLIPGAGPQPDFGPTDTTGTPPPISGGTLLVTFDGRTAVASDPDRDVIYGVDLESRTVKFTIPLQAGDEPGRLAQDAAGRIHVALRGGRALVTIDPDQGALLARRTACPAPRGVAWAASTDLVWVACATGELVALPASGGDAVQSLVIERDIRDVIAEPDGSLVLSKFRSAEVLRVGVDSQISDVRSLPVPNSGSAAHVAWRTIAGPSADSTVSVYQTESTRAISTDMPGGYTGGFPGSGQPFVPPSDGNTVSITVDAGNPFSIPEPGPIVESVVVALGSDGSLLLPATPLPQAVLPVDVALSPDGNQLAIAAAGNGFGPSPRVWIVSRNETGSLAAPSSFPVVAVAFDGRGNVLAQTLEPEADLFFLATGTAAGGGLPASQAAFPWVALSTVSNRHTGQEIFHTQAGAFIACASCHPEGGDDGHVWQLDGLPRRTPSLRGTIAGTAPYHWPGDERDMHMLVDDVYTRRMGGTQLDSSQHDAVKKWVEAIPAPPAPSWVDSSAARRGEALFATSAGCTGCHSGPKWTNNATVDIGTGTDTGNGPDGGPAPQAFQVPPLVGVGWRTPLFHNGCAATMEARFNQCATPGHGSTGKLSAKDVEDLVAYLESL